MTDNSSYDMAVEHVLEQIANVEGEFKTGLSVDVNNLQDCDCIPVDIIDGDRAWGLKMTHFSGPGRRILATYQLTILQGAVFKRQRMGEI